MLVWNPAKFTTAPTSWAAIYGKANSGKITVPDNPIQIADAALYLSKTKPSLGIKDPYELTSDQLDAAVALLKQQRPLVKKYWVLASDEIAAFTNGGVTIGAAWPLVPATLISHGVKVDVDDPQGGSDGLGRHLDGQLEGAAPELRDALAEVHGAGQGAGDGRQVQHLHAGQLGVVRDPRQALHAAARRRRREVLLADQVLEDADQRLRQRQERLHGLQRLAAGVDRDQGVSEPWPLRRPGPRGGGGPVRRLSAALYRRPRLKLGLLLVGPLGWLVGIYLVALGTLLIYGFWQYNDFTSSVDRDLEPRQLPDDPHGPDPTLRDIAIRTVKIAALVTIIDALIAFPLAYYMTRVAGAATRRLLLLGDPDAALLELPRARLRVAADPRRPGRARAGRSRSSGSAASHLGFSETAVLITFVYSWLPFMVLPVYGALERIPDGLLEASGDLGGRGFTTFRRVVLPLALPGVVAGSIFTFSLTLGDFITPDPRRQHPVHRQRRSTRTSATPATCPLAAAYAMVPIAIMAVYLLIARRLGAFESL